MDDNEFWRAGILKFSLVFSSKFKLKHFYMNIYLFSFRSVPFIISFYFHRRRKRKRREKWEEGQWNRTQPRQGGEWRPLRPGRTPCQPYHLLSFAAKMAVPSPDGCYPKPQHLFFFFPLLYSSGFRAIQLINTKINQKKTQKYMVLLFGWFCLGCKFCYC